MKSEIEGQRKWRIPNVKCPMCPLTAGPMRAYPCVDLSELPDDSPFHSPRPVSVERFQELIQMVRPFAPSHLPLFRTTGLGPFSGIAKEQIRDYAVAFLWGTPLVRLEAFKRLTEEMGAELKHVNASISSRQEPSLRMVELQIDGFVSLASKSLPREGLRTCQLCGSNNIKQLLPEWVTVKRSSIPDGNYFDLTEFPTVPIVSEKLKDAIDRARIANVRSVELEIVNE